MCRHHRFAWLLEEAGLFWMRVRESMFAAWALLAGYYGLIAHEPYKAFTHALFLLVTAIVERVLIRHAVKMKEDLIRAVARGTHERGSDQAG